MTSLYLLIYTCNQSPEFRDGWDEEKATQLCTERIKKAIPAELFDDTTGLTADDFIESCKEDIQVWL